jgi:hypothetical protein
MAHNPFRTISPKSNGISVSPGHTTAKTSNTTVKKTALRARRTVFFDLRRPKTPQTESGEVTENDGVSHTAIGETEAPGQKFDPQAKKI